MRILITGGAGFIGTALCRYLLKNSNAMLIVLDKLTYASNLQAIEEFSSHPRYAFIQADICDAAAVEQAFQAQTPTALVHLAAESHVDRSITNASAFIETNVKGTMILLEASRRYLSSLSREAAEAFRFLHVSTDEVFGDLGRNSSDTFRETSPYRPSSPYAASKAASDHLVRAWCRTHRFPAIVSNCSNNYGPEQFPEKLIPLICRHAMNGWPLPVYGDGSQVRDWLHVQDHARALWCLLVAGEPGATYAIGARNECRNLDLVRKICREFDHLLPAGAPHEKLITFVPDRPGHDERYAIDPAKITTEIGWRAEIPFEEGLAETVRWYFQNPDWQQMPAQASEHSSTSERVPA